MFSNHDQRTTREPLNVTCAKIIDQAGGELRLSEDSGLLRTISVKRRDDNGYDVVLRTLSNAPHIPIEIIGIVGCGRMVDDLHVHLDSWGSLVNGDSLVSQGRRSADADDLVLLNSVMKQGLAAVLEAGGDAVSNPQVYTDVGPTRVGSLPVELGELQDLVRQLVGPKSNPHHSSDSPEPVSGAPRLWDCSVEGRRWLVQLSRLPVGDLSVTTVEIVAGAEAGTFTAVNQSQLVLFTPGAFGGATVLDLTKDDFLGPWNNSRRPTVEEVLQFTSLVRLASTSGAEIAMHDRD